MNLRYENINLFWTSLIVAEFARNDIVQFCISPGARSSVLTSAIAYNSDVQSTLFYDERAAAFYALGYARATGKPAVLICTSGTAVANYLPAVIEAASENIPLVVISSDRPPELLDAGANQAVNQPNIFGQYAKWQCHFPCPTEKISPRFVLTTIDQAVYQAMHNSGVVHLNCMFREPLAPIEQSISKEYRNISLWKSESNPYTYYYKTYSISEAEKDILSILNSSKKGIIVVGKLEPFEDTSSIKDLIKKSNWPAWIDICSGMQFGNEMLISLFDSLLLNKKKWNTYKVDTVLHIGGRLISKKFLEFINTYPPKEYIVVKNNSRRYDPEHVVTRHVHSSISYFCQSITKDNVFCSNPDWLSFCKEKQKKIASIQSEFLQKEDKINELTTVFSISKNATNNIFISNSMSIRYFDMYAQGKKTIKVAANRGASGIDGNIATAVGFAQGLKEAVTVVIGDISLLHDLNSLMLVDSCDFPMHIVVLNNYGGSIFSHLPIAQFEICEKYFTTPHNYNFEKISAMFSLEYHKPKTNKEFNDLYQELCMTKKSCLIEVQTQKEHNHSLQNQLKQLSCN